MKKIIFALIFVLSVCASVSCVSASENTDMDTYNDDPSDLIELKGQIDNLEAITGQDVLLEDIIEFQFMNNTEEYDDDIIVDNNNAEQNHDDGEIQDLELNKNNSDNVKYIADTHYKKNTFFIIVSMIFNALNFSNFPDFFHFFFVS